MDRRLGWLVLGCLLAALVIAGACQGGPGVYGNVERIGIRCTTGGNCVEVWNGGDLVAYSDTGNTLLWRLDGNPGVWRLAVPTAVATATPGFQIDTAAVGNPLEIRKANTPVFSVSAAGAVTTAASVTAASFLDAGTFLNLTPNDTAETVTDGGTITPTNSFHKVTAAGAVGCTISTTGAVAGNAVTILNIGTNTITITDTGTTMLAGNAALGQYDTLTVLFDGTNWVELARSNN